MTNEHFQRSTHLVFNLHGVPQTFPTNRDHLNALISLYTNWFKTLQIVLLSACVYVWMAVVRCQQILSILNHSALQNVKLICRNKKIVNICVFVWFNAAPWSSELFFSLPSLCCFAKFCYAISVQGWNNYVVS